MTLSNGTFRRGAESKYGVKPLPNTPTLTTRELHDLGHHSRSIRSLVDAGRLHRIDRGLYATRHLSGDELLGAYARHRPHLVFTGRTAWQIRTRQVTTRPIVALAGPEHSSPTWQLELISSTTITHELVDGRRVAPVLRTAMDMPAGKRLQAIQLVERTYQGRGGKALLEKDLASWQRIPAKLSALLGESSIGADSDTERALFRILKSRGYEFEQNKMVGHYLRDGVHEASKVIVEVNGYVYHRYANVLVKDYWKANDAVARGYRHLTFSEECIDNHLTTVVQEIIAAIEGRTVDHPPVWKWHRGCIPDP